MELNIEQQNIVNSVFGSFLINAPVGTGKTTVLTERITKAIELGIRPDEILALTFTNKAADEMKIRLKERVDDKNDFDNLFVSTFHTFCSQFIKMEAKEIGISSNFLILDEDEQVELAKNILSQFNKIHVEKNREILNIIEDFYKYRLSLFQTSIGHNISLKKINPEIIVFGEEYLRILKEQNAFDFNELVLTVLESLYKNQEINERWANKFKFIQLDEFQDTHISEYLVVKELAKKHKNISLIGDIDQTIYSFRDSRPVFISKLFKEHFKPVKEMSLNINYRSNPDLIEVFLSLLNQMKVSYTKKLESGINKNKKEAQEKSGAIKAFKAYNFKEEVLWVIDNIKKLKDEDSRARIAVLLRSNYLINKTAEVFSEKNISFLTVDQYDFFRRQEVKDLFAYLKVLLNKNDLNSVKRIIERPAKNIGEETIKNIKKIGDDCGLLLSDFLDFKNYNFSEPFAELLTELKQGRLVVFDTETTGINPAKSDIIQIYAREIVNGKIGKEFHYYLKTKKSVGSSYFVHKISDDFLENKGEDPENVFLKLKNFIGDSIVCGHNVLFDINMVRENAKRYKINFNFKNHYDTLSLIKRFLSLNNYKLSNIAKHLNFKEATHSADDDVFATIDLLFYLKDKLEKNQKERMGLWDKYKEKFIKISSNINNWEKEMERKRPNDLLSFIWQESGLKDYYQKDSNYKQRERSFEILESFFKDKDDLELDNKSSLFNLIHYSSLVKNIDFLGLESGQIPIVTIHQVKGLEFDYIFLLGLNEGVFPFYKTEDLEEEKRLFYVALTRSKKMIFLSFSEFNDYKNSIARSQLVSMIDNRFIDFI